MELKCRQCGRPFESENERPFCSKKCYWEYRENEPLEIKQCPICGGSFADDNKQRKYCSHECAKEAQKRQQREYRIKNADRIREQSKAYYRRNRAKVIARAKERAKEYRKNNPERYREISRKYYQKHKNDMKEYFRNYYHSKKQRECEQKHGGCFNCPREDGECPYD